MRVGLEVRAKVRSKVITECWVRRQWLRSEVRLTVGVRPEVSKNLN